MKLLGDEMLNSGEVNSSEFSDNTIKFNRLTVNSISEVDLQTIDKNVIITSLNEKNIYMNDPASDVWVKQELDDVGVKERKTLTSGDEFNYIHFLSSIERYLSIDNLALSGLASDASFVIDWWMFQYDANTNGCLMYNGSALSPNPVENKELCISTSGDIVDPTTLDVTSNPDNDGYLNIIYPPLKSAIKINDDFWHHVALVAENGQIRLIIDAKVNDEVKFDGITAIEDLLVGFGYSSGIEAYISNLRITKDDSLNWFNGGFDLPVNDYVVGPNTEFLMDSTSFVDTTTNHAVTVFGDPLNIYQENRYLYLQPSHQFCIVDFDIDEDTTVYLPDYNGKLSVELTNTTEYKITFKSIYPADSNEFHMYPVCRGVTMSTIGGNKWMPTDVRSARVFTKVEHDDIFSRNVYISSFDGELKNLGWDTRVTEPINPPSIVSPHNSDPKFRSPAAPYDNTVIDMRYGQWVFAPSLSIAGGGVPGDVNGRMRVSFYMRIIDWEAIPANWQFLGSGYDGLGIDRLTSSYIDFTAWHYYGQSYTDRTDGWSVFYPPGGSEEWIYVEASWWSVVFQYSNWATGLAYRYVNLKIYDVTRSITLLNQSRYEDNKNYNTSAYRPHTYYMPRYFNQGSYLISNVSVDNT